MEELLLGLVMANPKVSAALALVGTVRLVMKPIVTAVHAVVEATPTKKDDVFLGKVKENKTVKTAKFVLDWLTSIKTRK